MERLVKISLDEYLILGDAGVWVYGSSVVRPKPSFPSDSESDVWKAESRWAKSGIYTHFYTKVSDDGTAD